MKVDQARRFCAGAWQLCDLLGPGQRGVWYVVSFCPGATHPFNGSPEHIDRIVLASFSMVVLTDWEASNVRRLMRENSNQVATITGKNVVVAKKNAKPSLGGSSNQLRVPLTH